MSEHDAERLEHEAHDFMPHSHRVIWIGPGWTHIVERPLETLSCRGVSGKPLESQKAYANL